MLYAASQERALTVGAGLVELLLGLDELVLADEGEHCGEVLVGDHGALLPRHRDEPVFLKDVRGELDAVGAETDRSVVGLEYVDAATTRSVGFGGGLEHVELPLVVQREALADLAPVAELEDVVEALAG